jgi:hypothetical protein
MPEDAKAQNLYRGLIAWLAKSPVNFLSSSQYHSLTEMCQAPDTRGIGIDHKLLTILEVHHDDSGLVDISFYVEGDLALLKGIAFPRRILRWIEQAETRNQRDVLPQQYWIEFDSDSTGYHLMGLFQRCSPAACDTKSFFEQIEPTLGASSFLSTIVNGFGIPKQLGLIARGHDCVKVVIPLRGSCRKALKQLMAQWFSPQLSNAGLNHETLADVLLQQSPAVHINLSLDCNLAHDKPGEVLCFEIAIEGKLVDKGIHTCQLHELLVSLNVPADQLRRHKKLRNQLPYAVRRPSINLIDQEYLYLTPSHVKACIGPDQVTLKDYLYLGALQDSVRP